MQEVNAILFTVFDVGLSLFLCIISVLGYTVYHIQMRKDSAQQARILNHLYSIFAYVSQAQSLTYFANVLFNHLRPEDLFLKCFLINIRALMSLLVLLTTILLTMGHLLSHHNPSYYLELSVKMETFHKWIMLILLLTFSASLVLLIPNFNENKSTCRPLKAIAKPLGIAIAICLLLLTSLLYQTRQLWIKILSRGLLLYIGIELTNFSFTSKQFGAFSKKMLLFLLILKMLIKTRSWNIRFKIILVQNFFVLLCRLYRKTLTLV